jgi:hypothetical protein
MDEFIEGLTYAGDKPNIKELHRAYRQDLDGNTTSWEVMRDSFDQTRMQWPGKTRDQKKHQLGAKPWPGASDAEVSIIEPRNDTLVALIMNAVKSGHVSAFPVGNNDAEEAANTSSFMRWMMDSWIPDFEEEIELSAHHFVEKGIAATFCGWEKHLRPHLERFDLEEIMNEQTPEAMEFAEMLMDEDREEEVLSALAEQFADIDEKGAKKALKQLRNEGVADVPVFKDDVDHPIVVAKDPSCDFIMPSWAMSAKRIPRIHFRNFMTTQDLLSNASSQGWDKDWVDEIIENHMGVTQSEIDGQLGNQSTFGNNRSAHIFGNSNDEARDLTEVVQTFAKFIDKESGAMGIWQIVWSPRQITANKDGEEAYALYELMNGYDEFPVVVTPFSRDTKRLYDVRSIPERLRGTQRTAKVTRDSTLDQFSITNDPPRTHPAGRPAAQWGAGADFATRRGEENLYKTLEIPNTRREGVELERYLNEEADFIAGLDMDNPLAVQRQQHTINRFLSHLAGVARLNYKNYQKLYGKEEIYFRITGSPDPQTHNKGSGQEELDVRIIYDTRLNDPEFVKETTQTLIGLKAANTDGNYSNKEIDAVVAYLSVPQFASRILRAPDAARQEILKNVADDLALIYSGQQVGARSEGANIALEYIDQTYMVKQSIQMRMSQDEEFAEALQIYRGQYEQQIVQSQNAVTGRLGTEAAELQGIQ